MQKVIQSITGETRGIGYMLWAIGTGIAAVALLAEVVTADIACPSSLDDNACARYQGQHAPLGQVALVAAAWLVIGVLVPYLIRRRHR
jgi:hypothetical protein